MTLDVVALRREIHAHPETAFREVRTTARVAEVLTGLGLEPRTGSGVLERDGIVDYPDDATLDGDAERAVATGADATWVEAVRRDGAALVVDVTGSRPGPTWALRFDTDALPIVESEEAGHVPAREGFRSTFARGMHACGHDGHVAIGLGLAERLRDDPDFAGTVRFLFQPAEEGGRGARAMLAGGALEGVDRFVALHLGLDLPLGHVVGGAVGAFATTKLRARFTGVASHAAAAPQDGRNALAAAAAGTLAVLAQPRWSTTDTRVNVGTLRAGDGVNIIPAWAELTAETRALDAAVQDEMTARVTAALQGAAASYGCEVTVTPTGGSTTMESDEAVADALRGHAADLGLTAETFGPMGGSDDASLFLAEVQRHGGSGSYVMVGADNPAPHHNPAFDVDERALAHGLDLLERLVRAG
ncbi:peptidase M20 [Marmoricola sp. Leaf446]|uniref:amidohydrolase n=1 Tax=Marmoricola sp. Leaf446 TaxID=1736379 RepID=UPI0006F39B59|nr:amidohydrolase [Marmoricola sp. Leaf446]KQT94140.1 peptidase M20 [Marmoricola sp. Leaf446]